MPHPNIEAQAATATPISSSTIRSKAANLAQQMRWIVKYSGNSRLDVDMRALYYADAQTAYSELAAEVGIDRSPASNGAQALLPSLNAALDAARTTLNNDDLIRLAVQLDHVA